MKVIAEANVDLPFNLDFCARGPLVEAISATIGRIPVVLHFPPSLSELTDGKGIFGEWAWWTGRRLRVTMQWETPAADVEVLRGAAQTAGDEMLRRFLNAYRWRFARADVNPVRIDVQALELFEVVPDGTRHALAEPSSAFFYRNMPEEAPIETSVNITTHDMLQRDVREKREPPVADQLDLDAEALDAQGEYLRAELVRGLARQQLD